VSGQTRGEGAANTSGDGGVAATPAFATLPVFALGRATPWRAAWQASLPRQKEIYLKSYGAPPWAPPGCSTISFIPGFAGTKLQG
jgi:hypothetical protein